jgi:hypothetical protein
MKKVVVAMGIALFVVVWAARELRKMPRPTEEPAPAPKHEKRPDAQITQNTPSDGSHRISVNQWPGCADREYFGQLTRFSAQGDREAFNRGLAAGIVNGECTLFKKGEVVFTVDTAIFSGLVKVRRRGNVQGYWTNLEAVD